MPLLNAGAQMKAQAEKDPHRPACTSAYCRKVKSYLKAHYCGESPYGNGPDDDCMIKTLNKSRTGISVIADYECKWSESGQTLRCEQHRQPSSLVRNMLIGELQHLGLPAKASGQTCFTVWKSTHSNRSIAVAYYSRSVGSDLELCEVVVVIDESSHVIALRKVPYHLNYAWK
jgi:hypothetical protein